MSEQQAWRQPTFAEALDVSSKFARRQRLRRQLHMLYAFVAVLVLAALAVAGFPYVLQWHSSQVTARTSDLAERRVAGWPRSRTERALAEARAYNRRLAASKQSMLGEAEDPFSDASGGSHASGKDSLSQKDGEYQSLLDTGDGVMGTVRIPKISVKLPIYHGTSESVLASGAGHLYGTSLPVGGASTHAVLTGHRGLVEAAMFTRLDEMCTGDFFYIEVMGKTLGYEVDRIEVILPSNTSRLRVVKGEDRVTLMTCTPYGVNTHRLLVSGHRVSIPQPAPDPDTMHDAKTMAVDAFAAVMMPGLLLVFAWRRRNAPRPRIMHHATVHLSSMKHMR